MKTSFSSSPWKVVAVSDDTLYSLRNAQGQLLASVYGYGEPGYFPTPEQAASNARLMNAAPAMFEALLVAYDAAAARNDEMTCVQVANAIHQASGENLLEDDETMTAFEKNLWSLAEWVSVLKTARLTNDKKKLAQARLFIVSATDEIVNGEFK